MKKLDIIKIDIMSRSIIKPAKCFSKEIMRKKAVEECVVDCLYRINVSIENANRDSKSACVYHLPVNFVLPDSIQEEPFRAEVYYQIVSELESKGYKLKMQTGNRLVIRWEVEKPDTAQWVAKLRSIGYDG